MKKRRQESVVSVAADPGNLENRKKAGREARGAQSLRENYTVRKNVFPLLCLISGFQNKYD